MYPRFRPVTTLEVLWQDDELLLRTPAEAYRSRGVTEAWLAPLPLALAIAGFAAFADLTQPLFWLLLGWCSIAVLGSGLTTIRLLTRSAELSAQSTWFFRPASPDRASGISLRGRGGAVSLQVPAGSQVVAVPRRFPIRSYRLVLQDARGRELCVLSQVVLDYYREEWQRAIRMIDELLGRSKSN